MIHKAQANPKQVVFPEGENERILRACHALVEEAIGKPILLGDAAKIQARAREFGVNLEGMQIVDLLTSDHREAYVLDCSGCGSARESHCRRPRLFSTTGMSSDR